MDDAPNPVPQYSQRMAARLYDLLNAALWLPRGSDRLRRDFVAALDVRPGQRVLELGCGTGLATAHLCAIGAQVVAVDRSSSMLAAARRRAPTATFVKADVTDPLPDGEFDHVVLSFVLHELRPPSRVDLLSRAAESLAPDGAIGIMDWARPQGALRGRLWSATMRAIEPAVAHDVLAHGLDDALAGASLDVPSKRPLAGGRSQVLSVVSRSRRAQTPESPS